MNGASLSSEADSSLRANGPGVTASISTSICPLCCVEDLLSSTSGVILSACQHRSCRSCLVKWIEREESSGSTTPSCPFCRSTICDEDVNVILGRAFQPRETATNEPNADVEIDELTLQWMNVHTVPCGACGFLIEKDSGCDLIECLCGYRFCYSCGAAGGECGCNPGHDFLNDSDDEYISDGPIRDRYGNVDLRSCMIRKEVRRERDCRRWEQREEEEERWDYSANYTCTSNGRWLFSSKKNVKCISVLGQQLGHEYDGSKRDEREFRRWEKRYEEMGRWNYSASNAALCTGSGRWLFSSRKNAGSILMLEQQLGHKHISRERHHRGLEQRYEEGNYWKYSANAAAICTGNGRWLLSSKKNAGCISMLTQQLNHESISYERSKKRNEATSTAACSGRWLFSSKKNTESILMLTQLLSDESNGEEVPVGSGCGGRRRHGIRRRGRGGWERRGIIRIDTWASFY